MVNKMCCLSPVSDSSSLTVPPSRCGSYSHVIWRVAMALGDVAPLLRACFRLTGRISDYEVASTHWPLYRIEK